MSYVQFQKLHVGRQHLHVPVLLCGSRHRARSLSGARLRAHFGAKSRKEEGGNVDWSPRRPQRKSAENNLDLGERLKL